MPDQSGCLLESLRPAEHDEEELALQQACYLSPFLPLPWKYLSHRRTVSYTHGRGREGGRS